VLPLGEFFTILLAEGKMKKNIAISRIADPIFNQSIKLPSKNKPLIQGLIILQ